MPPCSGQSRPSPCGWARRRGQPWQALRAAAAVSGGLDGRMLAARVEPKNGPKKPGSERRMFAEHIELPRIVVTFWRDGLVVTAYLGEVARLELQGDLHQRVRNVSGGFIGDGVFGRLGCALARHRGRSGLTLQSRPSCGSSCLR